MLRKLLKNNSLFRFESNDLWRWMPQTPLTSPAETLISEDFKSALTTSLVAKGAQVRI